MILRIAPSHILFKYTVFLGNEKCARRTEKQGEIAR